MFFYLRMLSFVFVFGGLPQVSVATPQEAKPKVVQFSGLRRVPEATVRRVLGLEEGEGLRPAQVRGAVVKLHQPGWFESIRVEEEASAFTFVLSEFPFLAAIEYSGSRLLDRKQIEGALDAAGANLQIARPADPYKFHRASQIIIRMLHELGHPSARVYVQQEPAGIGAVRIIFQIVDGPYLLVHTVRLEGATATSQNTLLRQMKEIAPQAWFAGLRHKDIFSVARADADAKRLTGYYQEHGYRFARLSAPEIREAAISTWRWFPWPRRLRRNGLELTYRVEEGPLVRWESFAVIDCDGQSRDEPLLHHPSWKSAAPHSTKRVAEAREYLARVMRCPQGRTEVDAFQNVNREAGAAHVTFRVRPASTFQIHRIEFAGHRRFPDRFYRRRLGLLEGEDWDPDKLASGLAAISRDGFVQAIDAQQVDARFDEAAGNVDLTIRVTESGRQRISLVGGASTIGIAYNLFNLFGGEEILTGYLEGGPPSLSLALGIARDGLLGNRAALGFSLFHNLLRPRLPGSRKERLFTASTVGVSQSFTYSPSATQAMSLAYQYDSSSVEVPAQDSIADAQPSSQHHFARSEVAASWQRLTKSTHLKMDAAASGGWLGGSQDLLRTSASAIRRYPLGQGGFAARWQTAGVFPAPWALETSVPFHARLYPGEELVRGLRAGELSPAGSAATLAGLDLLHGANLEYSKSLDKDGKTQLAGFVDGAVGWLRRGTRSNAASAFSFGLEVRWQIPRSEALPQLPLAGETIRVHYALAPWLRSRGRRGAWGWALGTLF